MPPITIDGTGTISGVTPGGLPDLVITAAELNGGQTGSAPIYGARAWVNFSGSPVSIRDSGNVSSVTDGGTGIYTVNMTTSLGDGNFAGVAFGGSLSATTNYYRMTGGTQSGTAFRVTCSNSGTTATDPPSVSVVIFK